MAGRYLRLSVLVTILIALAAVGRALQSPLGDHGLAAVSCARESPEVGSSTVAVTSTTAVVGAPAGSVVVQAGSNIQAVVDSKPAGSTFYLLAGV
ncbi:MAG TPA: hypothetical protein VM848_17365, partial [Acidimicrobiia bacterium]|nr:hypothetical protein [Acidimicrobiia bacterium]